MSSKAHDKLIFNTCYCLASAGHKVILLTKNQGISDEEIFKYYSLPAIDNMKIIKIRVSAFKIRWNFLYRFLALLKLLDLIKKNKSNIIIFISELKLGNLIIKFKKLLKVPVVYEFHDLRLFKNKIQDAIEEYVIKNADGIIVTTEALKEKIKSFYKRSDLIEKIPLATIPFSVTADKTYPPSHWKVFYIGQLYYLQGVDILIKAFDYLKDQPCSLHIVGGKNSEIKELKKIAEELAIEDRVVFYGYKKPSELSELVSEADILVIPSRAEERMPYVAHTKIYEYLSLGRPIIATDMESVREVLTDRINAIIVDSENPYAIAKGIKMVIHNPKMGREISANALKESENYTWQKRAQRLIDFFSRMVKHAH